MLTLRYIRVYEKQMNFLKIRMYMKTLISIILVCVVSQMSIAQVTEKEGLYYNNNGELYTGNHVTLNTDGTIETSMMIENGLLHGEVKFYDQKGLLQETGLYSQGLKEGKWIQLNSEGKTIGEAYYREGLKDGIWTVWDDQGTKRYHMVYSLGKKVDTWKMWDENASLVSERIYND